MLGEWLFVVGVVEIHFHPYEVTFLIDKQLRFLSHLLWLPP